MVQRTGSVSHRRYPWGLWMLGIGGALWVGGFLFAESHFAGKHLWLSRDVVKLGSLPPNAQKHVRVWVFNPTGQRIVIHPEASCGCTVADLPRSVLLPVDVLPIEIVVDTFGRQVGSYQQRVELICQAGAWSWRETIEIRYAVRTSAPPDQLSGTQAGGI
jgi:hypothetical protein